MLAHQFPCLSSTANLVSVPMLSHCARRLRDVVLSSSHRQFLWLEWHGDIGRCCFCWVGSILSNTLNVPKGKIDMVKLLCNLKLTEQLES
jgi:hypothetical protein